MTERQELVTMGRRVAILRVNEDTLKRKMDSLAEDLDQVSKQKQRLEDQHLAMGKAAKERILFLERCLTGADARIATMQRTLDSSVDQSHLHEMTQRCQVLGTRYRLLLAQHTELQAGAADAMAADMAKQEYKHQVELLERELELVKQRSKSREAQLATAQTDEAGHQLRLAQIRAGNEHQQAELLSTQLTQVKASSASLEASNHSLQSKVASLTQELVDVRSDEAQLREELVAMVSRDELQASWDEAQQLHAQLAEVQDQLLKAKHDRELALDQADAVQRLHRCSQVETTALKRHLLELQTTTDEKAALGRLHRRILGLQVQWEHCYLSVSS
jgi:centrosomal protein CEP290